jgi:hypothetical protein
MGEAHLKADREDRLYWGQRIGAGFGLLWLVVVWALAFIPCSLLAGVSSLAWALSSTKRAKPSAFGAAPKG